MARATIMFEQQPIAFGEEYWLLMIAAQGDVVETAG